jgi:hypothetical protein
LIPVHIPSIGQALELDVFRIPTMILAKRVRCKELEILIGRLNCCATILPAMHHFLGKLHQAMFTFLNAIVFEYPTHIYSSNASEFGLGGYNFISGRAWCFELPINFHLKTSLNCLAFLACMINIWIMFYVMILT